MKKYSGSLLYLRYNTAMKENIKALLHKYYKKDMVSSIMAGRRVLTRLDIADEAQKTLGVPILAWLDLKEYLAKDGAEV